MRNWLIYAKVLDMYLAGVKQTEIAKMLRVSKQCVNYMVHESAHQAFHHQRSLPTTIQIRNERPIAISQSQLLIRVFELFLDVFLISLDLPLNFLTDGWQWPARFGCIA